jgi:nucleoside-diphosphate-sugar epimerase
VNVEGTRALVEEARRQGVERFLFASTRSNAGTGAIVEPDNDASALTAILWAYRADPERRAREGEETRRRAVERFDAPVVGGLLEGLLGAGSQGPRRVE